MKPRRLAGALVLLTLATSCSVSFADPADTRPVVLTTFTVLADMARNVAGDHLRVESITKPGAEIHEYEVTPSDLRRADDAQLILDNGLGLELWFNKFVDRLATPHVVVSDGVKPIAIAAGSYTGRPNPHAWMSPLAAKIYVQNMAAAFIGLDPSNAADYIANAASYSADLDAVHTELVDKLSVLAPSQRALVTCEGAFPYLTRDAGMTEYYLWPVNGDADGTPQQVRDAISFIRDNDVPAVFCESTANDKIQQQVAGESGTAFGGTLYVDSLSAADGPVPTYLDLLRYDVDVITAGLTSNSGAAR